MNLLPRRNIHVILALTTALALSGCAAPVLFTAGAGAAASAGINQSMTGIASKTFTAPMGEIETAAKDALKTMALPIDRTEDTETGRKIVASAGERIIEVEFEKLSAETTRMSVTAAKKELPILRDGATATEIIVQTAYAVDDRRAARGGARYKSANR